MHTWLSLGQIVLERPDPTLLDVRSIPGVTLETAAPAPAPSPSLREPSRTSAVRRLLRSEIDTKVSVVKSSVSVCKLMCSCSVSIAWIAALQAGGRFEAGGKMASYRGPSESDKTPMLMIGLDCSESIP